MKDKRLNLDLIPIYTFPGFIASNIPILYLNTIFELLKDNKTAKILPDNMYPKSSMKEKKFAITLFLGTMKMKAIVEVTRHGSYFSYRFIWYKNTHFAKIFLSSFIFMRGRNIKLSIFFVAGQLLSLQDFNERCSKDILKIISCLEETFLSKQMSTTSVKK